ncbi:MAG: hypothetical protein NZ988_00640 [Thaumarchaeota archaeon]|nr:hypothetical protein [Candidatus Calditenuaceae archaeon]MDW8186543.1 hypothetical protein [Nitrososphaerota archaeon]
MVQSPLRDKDYFATKEGWLLSVLGDVHPKDRVWSILKYVEGPGPWRSPDGRTYSRAMTDYSVKEVLRTLDYVRSVRPDYVYHDPTVGNEVIAPPLTSIIKAFRTKDRASELIRSRCSLPEGSLERRAVELMEWLADRAEIPLEAFGVTGSILLGIAHRDSDVDLVVHGEVWVKSALRTLSECGDDKLRLGVGGEWVSQLRSQLRMTREDAELLASRVVNKGEFEGTRFSLFGVREKPAQKHGEIRYVSKGIVETVVEIRGDLDSLYTPVVYTVEEKVFGVERLVTYYGRLAGVLRPGDRLSIRAKLEEVRSNRGVSYQLLIGSYEGSGVESLKFMG